MFFSLVLIFKGQFENVFREQVHGSGLICLVPSDRPDFTEHSPVYLRDRLEKRVTSEIPCVRINGDLENRLPNTSSISFEYIEGEAILLRLWDNARICASSGSACTTGSLEPSHVLRALGLEYQALHGSVRFSLSRYTTDAEIDKVLEVMPGVIRNLRNLSPFGR